jgi:hypothetical protein
LVVVIFYMNIKNIVLLKYLINRVHYDFFFIVIL